MKTTEETTHSTSGGPAQDSSRVGLVERVRPSVLAIAILIAIILAESVFLFRVNDPEKRRDDVLAVSRQFLALLTTYSESTLATQRREVLALATGRFRTEFDKLTGDAFAKALKESKADSRGKVRRVGLTSISGDTATVIAIVDVTVKNKDLKTPRDERNVIELSLVHTSSGWRIDAVTVDGSLT